jgi:hypothetical protein
MDARGNGRNLVRLVEAGDEMVTPLYPREFLPSYRLNGRTPAELARIRANAVLIPH